MRHVPPQQVAHRIRLRTKRRLYAAAPALTERRYNGSSGGFPGWPVDFIPLDAVTESFGRPSLEENLKGNFELLNHRHALGRPIDWQHSAATQLWRYHLHYFDWAWVVFDDPSEDAVNAVAELYREWSAANPLGRWDAWSPYVVSVRAWTLCSIARFLRRDEELAKSLDADLVRHARYLRANVEFDVGGNHLIKNLKGLVGLAVFLQDEKLLRFAGRNLMEQVDQQILTDGGHFELSPGYHAQVLGDIIDVQGLLKHSGSLSGLAERLEAAAASMRLWLSALVQPDGSIPMLNDSMSVSIERRTALGVCDASRAPVTVLEASGYVVVRPSLDVCLVMDVGDPCPPELPAHAQADALSITLQVGGRPVLVDTGTSVYGAGARRQYERSTRAHNTVEIDGKDQTEVWGAFRAGRRHRGTLCAVERSVDGVEVTASHDGYRFLRGRPVHHRTVRVSVGKVRVEDVIAGRGSHTMRQFWHLAEGSGFQVDRGVAFSGQAQLAIDASDQAVLDWVAPGSHDLGSVARGHNERIDAPCLVAKQVRTRLPWVIGATVTW